MNSPAFFVMGAPETGRGRVEMGTTDSMLIRCLCLSAGFAVPAGAADLAPHRAVYDLSLASQSQEDFTGIEGRIAVDLTVTDCRAYAFDYRFVARFGEEGGQMLADQRIQASETLDGSRFDFDSFSFVDGVEQSRTEGSAETKDTETRVAMRQPVTRDFAIRAALFPLGHTRHLIERAIAGERIVETPLYDGDAEGENLLTTTAIITPLPAGDREPREGLADMRGWHVDESYFTRESDRDGLPSFHTRYTLFENGVTDELFLDFGGYALKGALSELTMGKTQSCP